MVGCWFEVHFCYFRIWIFRVLASSVQYHFQNWSLNSCSNSIFLFWNLLLNLPFLCETLCLFIHQFFVLLLWMLFFEMEFFIEILERVNTYRDFNQNWSISELDLNTFCINKYTLCWLKPTFINFSKWNLYPKIQFLA